MHTPLVLQQWTVFMGKFIFGDCGRFTMALWDGLFPKRIIVASQWLDRFFSHWICISGCNLSPGTPCRSINMTNWIAMQTCAPNAFIACRLFVEQLTLALSIRSAAMTLPLFLLLLFLAFISINVSRTSVFFIKLTLTASVARKQWEKLKTPKNVRPEWRTKQSAVWLNFFTHTN